MQSLRHHLYHLVPRWIDPPKLRPNKSSRTTEESIKNTLLWTYWRLIQNFPTDPSGGDVTWPRRCSTDTEVIDRIMAMTGKTEALEEKVALLKELGLFEGTRSTVDLQTGESLDEVRFRYKVSQAAWAARFASAERS